MMKNSQITIVDRLLKNVNQAKKKIQQKFAKVDYPSSAIVLEKYKTLYFPIPKVACTSLKKLCADLLEMDISPDINVGTFVHSHATFPVVPKKNINNYSDYYKFAFVRNPWDRLVSCYLDKIKENADVNPPTFINGVHKGLLKYSVFKAGMPFEEFVEASIEIPDINADTHFRSQYTFITDNNGKLLIDFLGKFENLNEDFLKLCEKLELTNITLPSLNSRIKNSKSYRDYYTQDLKNKVKKRYSKDIELFKYDF
jgi:hypothetical protein